ncbi:YbjN domain-containing protein [Martelella mediterranea]|uniref:Sensory transduction regulator n=1 Tax=Martelella mediterranea TaxID=293089 RepID=A0A4R3NT60_9HYPH|nr:YbjN domain-containing protein [Martelella mediterranea]TCT40203.1 hypothetical protein EDC90_101055 [Martelella mediterranea]
MSLLEWEMERQSNPVDLIEFVAATNDWSFERAGEDEIAMTVKGQWADYHVSFSWMSEYEALHIACAFDLRVADHRSNEVIRLLSLINSQVLMGHFDFWRQENVVVYRHSLLLAGGADPTNQQVEVTLSNALDACENYYQAFQFVVWSQASAEEAMKSVMFETVGEA